MPRPLAAAALSCPLFLAGCGDDGPSADGSGNGSGDTSSSETTSEAGTSGSGDVTDSEDDSSSPGTGTLPEDCAAMQGQGPCMTETLVEVPSPEVAFGDFDGDGDVDILALSDGTGPGGADEMILFLNDDGSFDLGAPLSFSADPFANERPLALSRPRPMWFTPSEVRSAFMQGTYGALGDVVVDAWWVRDGVLERFYGPTGSPPAGPWFGDFEGDGSTDLAFAPDASTLAALDLHGCTGQDCGAPRAATTTGAPAGPWTILGTDTTGDGLDELLVVRQSGDDLEVVVLDNDGTDFAASSTLSLGPDLAPASARLADVDADGRHDLVLTSTGDPASNTFGSVLHVFLQDGNGGLTQGPVIPAGERITGYAFADFDGDGTPDIGLRRTDLAIINVGLGPAFEGGVSYEITAEATGIVGQAIPTWPTEIVDLDGDGSLDIITVSAQEGQERYAANVLRRQ